MIRVHPAHSRIEEFFFAIIVRDTEGIIVAMN